MKVTLPGSEPFEVNGDLYLQLQVIEDARYTSDGPEYGKGDVSREVNRLMEHFRIKYDLD